MGVVSVVTQSRPVWSSKLGAEPSPPRPALLRGHLSLDGCYLQVLLTLSWVCHLVMEDSEPVTQDQEFSRNWS